MGEVGWAATFLKAGGLTSHRGQPTRDAGGGGHCQLRSALTVAGSLAASELPMAAGGPLLEEAGSSAGCPSPSPLSP